MTFIQSINNILHLFNQLINFYMHSFVTINSFNQLWYILSFERDTVHAFLKQKPMTRKHLMLNVYLAKLGKLEI